MQHPEAQIPMAQPHPTPQKHHSPNANPNVTAQKTADLTKRCACAVNSSSTLQDLTYPHVSLLFHTNLTHHASMPKPSPKASPNGSGMQRPLKQRVANKALPPDSQSSTRTLRYAFGNKRGGLCLYNLILDTICLSFLDVLGLLKKCFAVFHAACLVW